MGFSDQMKLRQVSALFDAYGEIEQLMLPNLYRYLSPVIELSHHGGCPITGV